MTDHASSIVSGDNGPPTTRLWQMAIVVGVGLCALWIDGPTVTWHRGGAGIILAHLASALLVIAAISSRHWRFPAVFVTVGFYAWSWWRFWNWMLNDRMILAVITLFARPLRLITGAEAVDLMVFVFVIGLLLASMLGVYSVVKVVKWRWLMPQLGLTVLLIVFILATSLYQLTPPAMANCFGVDTISMGLHCRLRMALGPLGTAWITLAFLMVPAAWTIYLARAHGFAASLLALGFVPFWIETIWNPVQIIGVPYFHLLRTSPVDTSLYPMLDLAVNLLNAIPIAAFLILIPFGLLAERPAGVHLVWLVGTSAVVLAVMYTILVVILLRTTAAFEFGWLEYIAFGASSIQVWLALLIAGIGSRTALTAKQLA